MTIRSRPHAKTPPGNLSNPQALTSWMRSLHDASYAARHGKFDCTTEITLTINVASSTLSDYRLSPQSVLTFLPTTANAAAEIGNGTLFVGTRSDGSCIITHANNAQADRTFAVSILG